ncbi:ribonuclease III [Angomonas deanei]|uniref:RNase III domain-containing protein n=1 Tax=Angomonas deanei TaxID=59799 RepID=S9VSD4_9TRYP|nr:ribonuclease III [Angomonas deanei]EPY43858.1 ribonuclease III [Angomonas deanei]CAD2215484.1 hypothetical protein, conserved [Angomonas deanei]|eukprot:EPY26368.1 ribonuclease III [Angomonas deanei]
MLRSTSRWCNKSALFADVVKDLTLGSREATLEELLDHPQVPNPSLPFIPPPRWAAELRRRLATSFPEVEPRQQSRFLRSFIHPSFTNEEGASGTMKPLIPLGESILLFAADAWVVSVLEGLRRGEANSIVTLILSDESLSQVLRRWNLEPMVLTDASAELLSKDSVTTTKGLVKWISSKNAIPDPYAASCVKAVVGSVFLENGMDTATSFCKNHVFSHIN